MSSSSLLATSLTEPALARLWVRRGVLLATAPLLVIAAFAGLARLGVRVPFGQAAGSAHGPLLVVGVFSTLIALERAVALGRRWSLAAPLVSAGAGVAIALHLPFAGIIAVASAMLLTAVNTALARRTPAPSTRLMLVASLALTWVTSAGPRARQFSKWSSSGLLFW